MGPDHGDRSRQAPCAQCGAIGCREKYEEMLAGESESPDVFGAVHHVTVICYNVQHPDAFSDEARAWMGTALRAIVAEGLSGPDMLKRARSAFGDGFKVKRRDARVQAPEQTRWSMTVADVRTGDPETYVADIGAWAKAILADREMG